MERIALDTMAFWAAPQLSPVFQCNATAIILEENVLQYFFRQMQCEQELLVGNDRRYKPMQINGSICLCANLSQADIYFRLRAAVKELFGQHT